MTMSMGLGVISQSGTMPRRAGSGSEQGVVRGKSWPFVEFTRNFGELLDVLVVSAFGLEISCLGVDQGAARG